MTIGTEPADRPRVALVSYSTKPRGGVVHTLYLAEELARAGVPVQVVTLGDPDHGFFRAVQAPYRVIAAPPPAATLEQRVFNSIDALEAGLAEIAAQDVDILHTQDCMSARAAARVRDAGAPIQVFRTVHHVDDFSTAALIECQRKAIEEPDRIIVVSEEWRARLRTDYGVDSVVIHNGVDPARFGPIDAARRDARRRRAGVADRFVFLSVGGIEPRKGSTILFQALAQLRREQPPGPALVIVGGHSFQDYAQYRAEALSRLPALGLRLGQDVVLTGTVSDEVLHEWYRSADALAFPSIKEGWGLAVLEALAADLPVVASDIAVLREYLTADRTAVLTRACDPESLAAGMRRIVEDSTLRAELTRHGRDLLPAFSWEQTARDHLRVYANNSG